MKGKLSVCCCCFLLLILSLSVTTSAQTIANERPSIGLVLSGGGARGAAHIGVIKVLEELRIPIDFIAGTSMGSIIGGLYAAGISPEEMEREILAIDWQDAFRDSPAREDLEYRRKFNDSAFLVGFQLGYRDGRFRLPKGFSSGQKLELILHRLTLRVNDVEDFDKLPIPFRAVTTDIETGELVVLDSGKLYMAMRASMSVPGAFAPVEVQGRQLIDGGLISNLPIDVMQEIGPDIIIAVDISSPYADPEAIDSFLGVTDQVLRIMTRNNTDREILHIGPQDILITPELGDMSAADFAGAGEAVRIGEESARQAAGALQGLSVSETEYAGYLDSQRMGDWDPPLVESIIIENESYVSDEIIERRMKHGEGQPLDLAKLEKDLSRIFGLGEFDKVGYLVENGALGSTIRIKPYGKSWGPNYIRFGMTLFDDFQGNSNYSLSVNHTRTQLNRLGAEWRNDYKLGINKGISSEFYQPLDYGGRFFIAPRIQYDETYAFQFFGDISGKYQIKITQFQLGAGMQFGRFGQIMAGVAGARARIKPIIGPNDLPEFKIRDDGLFATFLWDQIDNINFPKHGEALEMVFVSTEDFLNSDWIYSLLRVGVLKPVTWGRNTILNLFKVATSFDSDLPDHQSLELGGFLNLSGYSPGEITGQHGFQYSMVFYRQIGGIQNSALGNAVYLGGSLEVGNGWYDLHDAGLVDLKYSGSILIGLDTILGPLYLAHGFAGAGRRINYFYLGRTF